MRHPSLWFVGIGLASPIGPSFPGWNAVFKRLANIARFGGAVPPARWNVLKHSLLAAFSEDPHRPHEDTKAMLCHDAYEAWTGDIPTPYKSDEIRASEREFAAYHKLRPMSKTMDNECLFLEAKFILGVPGASLTEHFLVGPRLKIPGHKQFLFDLEDCDNYLCVELATEIMVLGRPIHEVVAAIRGA